MHGLREGEAIGAGPRRRVERDHVRAGIGDGDTQLQRGGDVHALVALFHQTDDGDVDTRARLRKVLQSLQTNARGTSLDHSLRHLRHRVRVPHRLPRVRLAGDDELALQITELHNFSFR